MAARPTEMTDEHFAAVMEQSVPSVTLSTAESITTPRRTLDHLPAGH